MIFNDLSFVGFLVAVLAALAAAPARWRGPVALGASLVLLATFREPRLVLLLAGMAVAAWWVAGRAERAPDEAARRRWALGGAAALVAVLVLVKVLGRGGALADQAPGPLRFGTTIAVSYFTLQAVSYLLDVYVGRIEAERSLWKVMTYLAFFPKLLQGPLERAGTFLPQLARLGPAAARDVGPAFWLFGWGLLKKVVLADRLGRLVDPVYGDPGGWGGLVPLLATYAYAFQLYFDFSGYTDMARAAARLMGIELSENFRSPYLAGSIGEFWRRWHMTFSRWLLDYVFTPLQLQWRRRGARGTAAALLVTFTLSGLWHGLALTFLIWGGLHGLALAAETLWKAGRGRRPPPGRWAALAGVALTFHVVCLAWVFFRAPSLGAAVGVLGAIGGPGPGVTVLVDRLGGQAVAVTAGACAAYAAVSWARRRPLLGTAAASAPLRWVAGAAVYLAILLLRQDAGGYLYFQF